MRLSIIIPVYNGAAVIGACLDSLFASRDVPALFEVIVVDDGSTDGTKDIVQRYPVQYVRIDKTGVAGARNAGIRTATGDVIVLFDADVIVQHDTLRKMHDHLEQDRDAAVVQGRWARTSPVATFSAHFFLLKYHYNFTRLFANDARLAVANLETGCVAIRREVFDAVGFFNPRYKRAGGEEHELGARILKRFRIYYYPDIFVEHRFGRIMPSLRKIYFRSVNFAMLIFGAPSASLLPLHGPSAPDQDRYSVILLLLAVFAVPFAALRKDAVCIAWAVLTALYLINISGFLRYARANHGMFFAVKSIFADVMIMVPRLAGLMVAACQYFILRNKEYKI